ncbi:MAG: hypothetical protein HYZ87_03720, partial [Candidatus Omnitrophica bacterium]|nr:hypothetical protein [Candidatus Omnitrophota bacterium]
WNILLELGVMLGLSFHFTTPEQIFLDLAKHSEVFRNLDYQKIGSAGHRWGKA